MLKYIKQRPGVFMKRFIAAGIVMFIIMSLAGCTGSSAKLNGDWEIVSGSVERFGSYLRFNKDGSMYCTPGLKGGDVIKSIEDEFNKMSKYYAIEYHARKNKKMELTIEVLGAKVTTEVAYTLDGDVLIFDGRTYKRIA